MDSRLISLPLFSLLIKIKTLSDRRNLSNFGKLLDLFSIPRAGDVLIQFVRFHGVLLNWDDDQHRPFHIGREELAYIFSRLHSGLLPSTSSQHSASLLRSQEYIIIIDFWCSSTLRILSIPLSITSCVPDTCNPIVFPPRQSLL